MKIGAHPMVVAVALGFLAPSALAEDEAESREDERASGDAPCACGFPVACGATTVADCENPPPSDPLDVAQIEAAWTALRR